MVLSDTALSLPRSHQPASRSHDAAGFTGATNEAAIQFVGGTNTPPATNDIDIATLDVLNGDFWDLPYWPSLMQLDHIPADI